VKDTKAYQVQMVNGQQPKTEVNNQQAQQGGRDGRLKKRVEEHVKDEYTEYGQSIAALAKRYTTPDPDRLMQAKQAGNISFDAWARDLRGDQELREAR
jgi:flagellar hook-associated protein FlgK